MTVNDNNNKLERIRKTMTKKTTMGAMTALAAILIAQNSALGQQQASLNLGNFNAALCYHNDTGWTLDKTANPGSIGNIGTAAWIVSATKGATTPNDFIVYGYLDINNSANQGTATIGNIVVNLQKAAGACQASGYPYVSAAADVSTASAGDVGTVANVVAAASQESPTVNVCSGLGNYAVSGQVGTYSESAGSGQLQFFNADDNSLWALTDPAKRNIAPGATVHLIYFAHFDASAPGMPGANASIRVETLVTFGNAGNRGNSGASANNVDIDMDGAVNGLTQQTDENFVRTVPTRFTTTMPALVACNSTVELKDSGPELGDPLAGQTQNSVTTAGPLVGAPIDDLLTDTATYNISQDVNGGTFGGQVCNTATLTGVNCNGLDCNLNLTITDLTGTHTIFEQCCKGVNLTASACVSVAGSPAGFPGEFCTFTQGGWGAKPNGNNPGALLAAKFSTVYPGGSCIVGGAKTMTFKDNTVVSVTKVKGKNTTVTTTVLGAQAIEKFLPAQKPVGQGAGNVPGQLTDSLTNPDKSSAGVFGGQVLALELNVDFSNAGVNPGGLGGVKYCANDLPSIHNWTISQILAGANAVLGGATPASQGFMDQGGLNGMTIAQLNDLITNLNEAYDYSDPNLTGTCNPSPWATDHLCAF